MVLLTNKTTAIVERFFVSPKDREEAVALLQNDCSNTIWKSATPIELERLWFSVIKLSKGSLPKLVDAIAEAQTDYRDVLMAADFGIDVNDHLAWAETILNKPTSTSSSSRN